MMTVLLLAALASCVPGSDPAPPLAGSQSHAASEHAAAGNGAAAAKPCAPRLQSYFASDFKDAAYQQKAFQKVASAWKRPAASPAAGAKAVVIVSIAADGSIAAPVLHMKSGSDGWDAAALAAVKSAAPFDPLPKSYPHPSVEVHFHFECAP